MSQMHSWLAQAYGTNGGDADLEKTAQALMLSKLAQDEGIDLSGLNEEQLTLLAQEVAQQVAAQGGGAAGDPTMGGAPQPGGAAMGGPPAGGMPGAKPAMAQPAPMPGAGGPAPAPQGAGAGVPQPGAGGGPQDQFTEEQIKVAQAKMAEADFLGRMMAHAMHQELGLIKAGEDNGGAPPFPPKDKTDEEKKEEEEAEAEKSAAAFLQSRGYVLQKQASSEGPLTRAIRALGGTVK
jgi:hypothetical protein